MGDTYKAYYSSAIGVIEIRGSTSGIVSVDFVAEPVESALGTPAFFRPWIKQFHEYFQGKRNAFSLPLQVQGTEFEKKVWGALQEIPYGTTQSYGDIARKIGHEKAFRAVGNANNKNRIAIIIPCHRVIGSDGSLTGYASGLWRKEWLLDHEKKYASSFFSVRPG